VRADASFIRDNGDGSIARVTAYFHTLPQLVADGHPLDIEVRHRSRTAIRCLYQRLQTTAREHLYTNSGMVETKTMYNKR